MALIWNWEEKIGEIVTEQSIDGEVRYFTKKLYEGNAFLICINEWTENGEGMYSLNWFFLDERHAKNCLGLTKGHENIFTDGTSTIRKLRINTNKSRNWKKIVDLFISAFDSIEIELYKEDEASD
jgi:hypothetical protein